MVVLKTTLGTYLTSPTNAWRTWFRRHSSKESRTSTSRHFRHRLLSLANGQSGTSTRQCQRLLWGNGLCCGWVYNDELWGQSPCKRYVWHWHILQRIKVCYIFCISFISMSRRKWYIEGIFNKAKKQFEEKLNLNTCSAGAMRIIFTIPEGSLCVGKIKNSIWINLRQVNWWNYFTICINFKR